MNRHPANSGGLLWRDFFKLSGAATVGLEFLHLTMMLKPVSLREGKLILRAGNPVWAACQGAKGTLVKRPDGLWEVQLQNMADQAALLLRWR